MSEKVALEVAEMEFDRFVDLMALDLDPKTMDEADKADVATFKSRMVSAIQSGHMTVDEEGQPSYTPCRVKDHPTITFYEPTGASLKAMDRRKSTEDIGKLFATMADITKTSAQTFSKMKIYDLKVCMAVTNLFLG